MEKLSEFENGKVVLKLDRIEVVALANALNEAREALEDWEFSTRMGVESEQAETLRRAIVALLRSSTEGEG